MKKSKKLVIIGAGEFAQIAYEYFTHDSEYEVAGFCVEKEFLNTTKLCELPIFPVEEIHENYPSDIYDAFVAIPASDMNQTRTRLFNLIKNKGYFLASYISSAAFVWHNVVIGENTFVFENNTLQPSVTVGDNVVLWSGNHIGHRTVIGNNVFVSSHVVISGFCQIGDGCFLGVNSTLNDEMSIAKNSLLASGSLVNRSLEVQEGIYRGQPAKLVPGKSALTIKL